LILVLANWRLKSAFLGCRYLLFACHCFSGGNTNTLISCSWDTLLMFDNLVWNMIQHNSVFYHIQEFHHHS
jgi:hypothetical protein